MRKRPIVTLDGDFEQLEEPLNTGAFKPVTLIGATIDVTQTNHVIDTVITTDLHFITGGENGDLLVLTNDSGFDITLWPSADLALSSKQKLVDGTGCVTLINRGSQWVMQSLVK